MVQLAGSDDDIEAKKADITLTMAKPIPARLMPQVGAMMTFQGTIAQLHAESVHDDHDRRHAARQERQPGVDGTATHHTTTTTHHDALSRPSSVRSKRERASAAPVFHSANAL